MKKLTLLIAAALLLWAALSGNKISAKAGTVEEDAFHIIFVLDHSGSMSVHDGNGVISGLFGTLADTLAGENVEIGYVAYNDAIIAAQPPASMESPQERSSLKEALEHTGYQGETDIGLGLHEAWRMMERRGGKRMIVLLSDGETDLEHSDSGRTKADSDRDVQQVAQTCRAQGIQVSTIAFGQGAGEEGLRDIAEKTGGASYLVHRPEELVRVFGELLYDELEFAVSEAGSSIYGQGSQKISLENSRGYDRMTVLLVSDKKIINAGISAKGQEDIAALQAQEYEEADYYWPATLDGGEGSMTVSFDTAQGQRVSVYVVGKREVIPAIHWPEMIYKNSPTEFRITFADKEGKAFTDQGHVLQDFSWDAELVNVETGESKAVMIENGAGELSGTLRFGDSGRYELHLEDGMDGRPAYTISGIQVRNTLPESRDIRRLELLAASEAQAIDLAEYFTDADGDALTFSLQEGARGIVSVRLDQGIMEVSPLGRGSGEIRLIVSDGEGELACSIPVRVRSLPEAYWQLPALFLAILMLILWKALRKTPKAPPVCVPAEGKNEGIFTGRLNAYFTLLPEGEEEIQPLSFALHPIREKRIVLKDMFAEYPGPAGLLELEHIYLFPGEGRRLVLCHESGSTVMIGSSLACRKMQYDVSAGNVIYITSKEGACELEVHFIQ